MNKVQIKEKLESLKGNSELKNDVIDHFLDQLDDIDSYEDLQKQFEDLAHYGCQSGMINELIYYEDTIKFYNKHKEEINLMLRDLTSETGMSVEKLFGDKFDKEDPLVLDDINQNLLAWFAFEETAAMLYEELENEKEIDFE